MIDLQDRNRHLENLLAEKNEELARLKAGARNTGSEVLHFPLAIKDNKLSFVLNTSPSRDRCYNLKKFRQKIRKIGVFDSRKLNDAKI
jgi:hypothetical protein